MGQWVGNLSLLLLWPYIFRMVLRVRRWHIHGNGFIPGIFLALDGGGKVDGVVAVLSLLYYCGREVQQVSRPSPGQFLAAVFPFRSSPVASL